MTPIHFQLPSSINIGLSLNERALPQRKELLNYSGQFMAIIYDSAWPRLLILAYIMVTVESLCAVKFSIDREQQIVL